MARTSIPVSRNILEKAIEEVEKSGPLSNHAALFEAACKTYNKIRGDFSEITPAVVRLRVIEWNIGMATVAGRRGRQPNDPNKVQAPTQSSTHLLCRISDWQESVVEMGPYKGTTSKHRFSIISERLCWTIGIERNNSQLTGIRFSGNMKHLLPDVLRQSKVYGYNIEYAIKAIVEALAKLTGKPVLTPKSYSAEDLMALGIQLDRDYKTNYLAHWPCIVPKDLFGDVAPIVTLEDASIEEASEPEIMKAEEE